ncbi:hypothetical protein AA313_de0208624 [Arthrobotrys entomopaga]|nr:hypothetical protein AA313_de0208624 [Arthrobotrys entomopaga]
MGAPEESTITIIDRTGDTIISCCDEAGQVLESFQVSSNVLSLSSKVFRVMVDPSGPYAQPKDSFDRRRLKLTIGQPRFIKTILHILHHQNNQVPMKVQIQDLASLAEICDFYDLSEALKPWTNHWTHQLWTSAQRCKDLDLWCRMSIAFSVIDILDEVSIELVKTSRKDAKGTLLPFGESSFPCNIPETLPDQIWRKREELLGVLMRELDAICTVYRRIITTGSSSSICQVDPRTAPECDAAQLVVISKISISLGYPVISWNAVSLDEILKAFESAKDEGSKITYHKSGVYGNAGYHNECSITGRIREVAKKVSEALQSLTYAIIKGDPADPVAHREPQQSYKAKAPRICV